MLPKSAIPEKTIVIADTEVVVRGLTMNQVEASKGKNAVAVSYATGCTHDEAKEWLDTAPAGDVVKLLTAIADLSGLGEGAQKSGPAGDDARGSR